MADPALRGKLGSELKRRSELLPPEAAQAFQAGDEMQALTLLRRARDGQGAGSAEWAYLERLTGLVLIHLQREVEGTFALERADPLLEAADWPRPALDELG